MEPVPGAVGLSIDEQFAIASFNTIVGDLRLEDAIELLRKTHEQLIIERCCYRSMLADAWGIKRGVEDAA